MKVVKFLGDNLSTVDCLLLTSDLTLRSNGTAAFITNILGVGTALTYHFNFEVLRPSMEFIIYNSKPFA